MSKLYKLPDGWEWKTIEKVLSDIKTGTTPPKKEQKYYDNPTINWFSPSDFGKHKELINSKNMINSISITDKKAKVYPSNSLLLVAIGATVGKIGLIRKEASSNQQITAMIFKNNIDVDFSYYWFIRMKKTIINTASAATLPIINQKGIKSLPFPLPPLQEQKRIVSKLDNLFEKIDKSIALHQKNMDEADLFMGSVLNDVFTKLEKKQLITKKKLDECFIVKDGTHDSPKYVDEGYPLFTSKNLKDYGLDTSNFKSIKKIDYDNINKRSKVDKGDLLFAMIGTIGSPTIVDFEPNFAIKNMALFKLLDNKSLITYLRYYFMSESVIIKMKNEANGATQKFVGLTYLRKFPFPLSPLNIQQKTVKYLDKISEKIEKIKSIQKEKMDNLVALKASILDRAFIGEL